MLRAEVEVDGWEESKDPRDRGASPSDVIAHVACTDRTILQLLVLFKGKWQQAQIKSSGPRTHHPHLLVHILTPVDSFKKARSIAPLHTAGPVAVTADGKRLLTCVAEEVLLTDVATGVQVCRFAGDTQPITALCVTPSSSHLLVFTSALALRIYELPDIDSVQTTPVQPIRVVARAHDAPVHVCTADPTSTYLASGAADGVVKVWDIARGYTTHAFKGHGGVVSALAFSFPRDPSLVNQTSEMRLVTASVDTRIRIFDLGAAAARTAGGQKPVAVLEGHVSVPRGLDVSRDGRWLVSGGRDSVVLVWDLAATQKQKGTKGKEKAFAPALAKTIPILERVEAVGLLRPDEGLVGSTSTAEQLQFYTGGEKGVVKIWDARAGTVLFTLGEHENVVISDEQEEQRQIVDMVYVPETSTLVSVHADQNILFHDLASKTLARQLIGFNDEVIDAAFLSPSTAPDTHLALATNSSLIRVYDTATLDARLLSGHTEIVLCLAPGAGGRLLASGSKDRAARLWAPSSAEEGGEWGCVAVCEGHAESVGAIALPRRAGTAQWLATGSQDRTIKLWDLSGVPAHAGGDVVKCKSLATHKAHEKDINALDVAPDDQLLASGSQDKTAKIFAIEYASKGGARAELKLLGTCRGHKRGVWSVRFGRAERVLATGSGDRSVRLWSVDDFACVRTFEGHTGAVLRVEFLNAGMQLASAAGDGLVKLWAVRGEECLATLDAHEDKVWALAVSADERTLVSGAADSVVAFWEDCTEAQEEEREETRAALVLKEQDFQNYVALHDYRRAMQLALAMEQPSRLLALFTDIRGADADGSITGRAAVDEVVRTLPGPDLARLLRYVRDWNAKAKTSVVAQGVLRAIVELRAAEDVMQAFGDGAGAGATPLKELVDALIPYTERHLARMDRLLQESYVVDYILSEMDDGMFDADMVDDGASADTDAEMGVAIQA
ncbi:hypothetical protein HWV62_10276 [Athelia sp. TMB]|nr:hypothetical protein HWV62_10276 [Athelia sp. TMB]